MHCERTDMGEANEEEEGSRVPGAGPISILLLQFPEPLHLLTFSQIRAHFSCSLHNAGIRIDSTDEREKSPCNSIFSCFHVERVLEQESYQL